MKNIKYHQHGIGNEYDEDHSLTNNWDPNRDYGKEYVRVYFHIHTDRFNYRNGYFENTQDRDEWNEEASNLIKSLGILEDCGFRVEQMKEKCAYLYAHPSNFSGVVLKNDVKRIAQAISQMKLSDIRWVALHETVYVLTDDEYAYYLDTKLDAIRKDSLEGAVTTRTTKYCSAFDVARNVASHVRLPRLGLSDGRNGGTGQTVEYVLTTINRMIEEGSLKEFVQNGTQYIRSLNKTELRLKMRGCTCV